MLKIYFDWNIITHLKDEGDKSRELLNAIRKYSNYFIYPFSEAHLRDLTNGDKDCLGYKKDLRILNEICGTHLLEYNNETNSAYPYQCSPSEYLNKKGDELLLFTSGFSETSFSKLFAKYRLEFTHLMDALAKVEVQPLEIPWLDISVRNGRDMLKAITQLGERYARDRYVSRYVRDYINGNTTEQQRDVIKYADADTIFQELNNITIPQVGKAFVEIVGQGRHSMVNSKHNMLFN